MGLSLVLMYLCLEILLSLGQIDGRIIQGVEQPSTGKSWVYVDNFAFVPKEAYEEYIGRGEGAGSADWKIWHSFEGDSPEDDSESMWLLGFPLLDFRSFQESVLSKGGSEESYNDGEGLSCAERIAKAKIAMRINANSSEHYDHNAYIQDAASPRDDWKSDLAGYKYMFSWHKYMDAEILGVHKPRSIYWAFANCRSVCTLSAENAYCGGNIDVYYRAHFGQYSYKSEELDEFSYEFHGLLLFSAVMFVIYTAFITPSACLVFLSLWAHDRAHVTVYLLGASILLSDLQFLFLVAPLGAFASHGRLEEIEVPLFISLVCLLAGSTCLTTLLLSLSGGWTVTRRKLKVSGRIRLAVFITIYSITGVAALALFAVGENSRIASSPAGALVVVISGLAWLRFMRQSNVTITKWPRHRAFYTKLRVLGTVNLLGLVLAAFVGIFLIETNRFRYFMIFSGVAVSLTQLSLLIMYHPRILTDFPFHATIEDMKTYKLKKRSDRIAGLVRRIDGTSGTGGDGAAGAEAGVAGSGGAAIDTISFTGGSRALQAGTLTATATATTNAAGGGGGGDMTAPLSMAVDTETGKLKLPSYFDRIQIMKLREISSEVDAAVHHLNEYSVALNEILDEIEIDTGHDEGDGAFDRMVHKSSLADDVQGAIRKFREVHGGRLRAISGGGKGGITGGRRYVSGDGGDDDDDGGGGGGGGGGYYEGDHGGSGGMNLSTGARAAWREAGMTSRPRTLSAREEQRRREAHTPAESIDSKVGGAVAWHAYREETMEGTDSDHDHFHEGGERDDAPLRSPSTPSRRPSEAAAIATPGGRRGASFPVEEIDGAFGPGKESEDALRLQWRSIEQQELVEEEDDEEKGAEGAKWGILDASRVAFSPRAPPPISGPGPGIVDLDMATLKDQARTRMKQAGSIMGRRASDQERYEEDDL